MSQRENECAPHVSNPMKLLFTKSKVSSNDKYEEVVNKRAARRERKEKKKQEKKNKENKIQ